MHAYPKIVQMYPIYVQIVADKDLFHTHTVFRSLTINIASNDERGIYELYGKIINYILGILLENICRLLGSYYQRILIV